MGAVVFILCFLSCLPLYAGEVSELKDQVAVLQEQVTTQQEQILELQRQMRRLMEDKGERPLVEHSKATKVAIRQREPRVSFKLKPGYMELRREQPPSGYSSGRVGGVARVYLPRWT
ncbi:MAG TPA: hypothetical protein ACFYD2_08730 [Candidatus Avalokitesvara rifleensis]|uniref:hypothetical protein n=1 Tax=Candidatus Avalokitesvara rifleensis TaxID=3367620 RepID=UPI002713896C|nr:hypothetical protein [Candidatus Brocadiales bacterium]